MLVVFLTIACGSLLVLVINAVFGGDHEFGGHEVHFEHGYDSDGHDHEGASGPSPFSVRILSVFGTSFGAVGAACSYGGLNAVLSTLAGLGSGIFLGWSALVFYRFMSRQQANSTVSAKEAVGKLAEVHTTIPATGIGQVSFVTKGQRTYLPARSRDGVVIPAGSTVEVIDNPSGTLVVRAQQ